jgi:hypothetical protein
MKTTLIIAILTLASCATPYATHRDDPHYRVTASLEGRYKCPQCWEEKQINAAIDTIDALAVERVVIRLPDINKAILKYSYFTPYIALNGWCRKNRVRADQFELELARSIKMVDNLLR